MTDTALPSVGQVLAVAVPALLTFGTAAALSALGRSTGVAVGAGLLVGFLAGQLVRRVRD